MSVFRAMRHRRVSERMCLGEAALLHIFVAAALRIVTFARLQDMLGYLARIRRRAPSSVSDITWAISAAGTRMGGATCLTQAAVAYTMLRRHGYDARLRIGVRRGESVLEAHAWVECGGTVVMGELPEMTGYAMLA